MASFASSATTCTCSARKHAWTKICLIDTIWTAWTYNDFRNVVILQGFDAGSENQILEPHIFISRFHRHPCNFLSCTIYLGFVKMISWLGKLVLSLNIKIPTQSCQYAPHEHTRPTEQNVKLNRVQAARSDPLEYLSGSGNKTFSVTVSDNIFRIEMILTNQLGSSILPQYHP